MRVRAVRLEGWTVGAAGGPGGPVEEYDKPTIVILLLYSPFTTTRTACLVMAESK